MEKVVEKSGPTLEQELKKVFGMKSETSLGGSRIENLGKYFLDKHTGQVSLVTYHRGDPVRWNVLRENVPEDYQLVRYGDHDDNILLINLNLRDSIDNLTNKEMILTTTQSVEGRNIIGCRRGN